MLSKLMDALWDMLDNSVVISFGQECAAVMGFTVVTLMLRVVLVALRLHPYIPSLLVFACPPLMERYQRLTRSQSRLTPNLPVRIAESLLGRTGGVLVVLPAHFLGGIVGVTVVKLLLSISTILTDLTAEALMPVIYDNSSAGAGWTGLKSFFQEIIISVLFVLGYLVVPELLKVNRRPKWWAWLGILPILLVKLPDKGTTLSPAALYALWYGSRETVSARFRTETIQYEHVFGPIIGGFLAGSIMAAAFPDEPAWSPVE